MKSNFGGSMQAQLLLLKMRGYYSRKKNDEIFKFETTTTHQPYNYCYITLFNDGVGYSHKINIKNKVIIYMLAQFSM